MKKIILIEPDQQLAKLYSSALEASGHQVKIATSAQAALYEIETLKPELIFLEIDIPGHNGLEFMYEFCSYTDWQDIKLVIHSSLRPNLFEKMKVAWSELGVQDYLYKVDTSLQKLQEIAA